MLVISTTLQPTYTLCRIITSDTCLLHYSAYSLVFCVWENTHNNAYPERLNNHILVVSRVITCTAEILCSMYTNVQQLHIPAICTIHVLTFYRSIHTVYMCYTYAYIKRFVCFLLCLISCIMRETYWKGLNRNLLQWGCNMCMYHVHT